MTSLIKLCSSKSGSSYRIDPCPRESYILGVAGQKPHLVTPMGAPGDSESKCSVQVFRHTAWWAAAFVSNHLEKAPLLSGWAHGLASASERVIRVTTPLAYYMTVNSFDYSVQGSSCLPTYRCVSPLHPHHYQILSALPSKYSLCASFTVTQAAIFRVDHCDKLPPGHSLSLICALESNLDGLPWQT